MKGLFWALGAFALAVGVSLAFRPGDGYVLLVVPPYRIDFSIGLAVVMLLVGFAAVYAMVRLFVHTVRLPEYVRTFRARQKQEKAQGALQAWFEGRFSRAEKLAATAWDLGAAPAAVSLVAAHAAQRVRNSARRDLWLKRADETGSEQDRRAGCDQFGGNMFMSLHGFYVLRIWVWIYGVVREILGFRHESAASLVHRVDSQSEFVRHVAGKTKRCARRVGLMGNGCFISSIGSA